MTNFGIFDKSALGQMVDPFIPGMSGHITPIKYEAITPDLFCFLFRTTGKNHEYYFFIVLEYDYLPDLAGAKQIIEKWHGGQVLEFFGPAGAEQLKVATLADLSHAYDKTYKGLLARVSRPAGEGYWATNFVIMPGDKVADKLMHLTEQQQKAIQKGLANIFKKQLVTNTTNTAVSVFVKPDGSGFEFFFNRVPGLKDNVKKLNN